MVEGRAARRWKRGFMMGRTEGAKLETRFDARARKLPGNRKDGEKWPEWGWLRRFAHLCAAYCSLMQLGGGKFFARWRIWDIERVFGSPYSGIFRLIPPYSAFWWGGAVFNLKCGAEDSTMAGFGGARCPLARFGSLALGLARLRSLGGGGRRRKARMEDGKKETASIKLEQSNAKNGVAGPPLPAFARHRPPLPAFWRGVFYFSRGGTPTRNRGRPRISEDDENLKHPTANIEHRTSNGKTKAIHRLVSGGVSW